MPTAAHLHAHAPAHQRRGIAVLKSVAVEAWDGFNRHQLPDLAAALTYTSIFSLFPATLAMLGLIGLVASRSEGLEQLLALGRELGAGPFLDPLKEPLTQLAHSGGSTFALIVGIALALWGSLGYVACFGRAQNRIWQQRERRGFVRLTVAQLGATFGIVALIAMNAVLLVAGPLWARALDERLGGPGLLGTVWSVIELPVAAVIAITALWIVRSVSAEGSQPWLTWGAGISIVAVAVATIVLGWYVRTLAHFASTYGTLSSLIGVLLWLWLVNLVLLVGAEVDRAHAANARPSFTNAR
ncbi:MAG TPA: YihY/virulence factor BrkB family protein [Microbacteriaceae bacterium]|nr:YihY/virulence factor BrkB family protein [Microbacteriaceae bacterium]